LDELERVIGQQKRAFDTAEMHAKINADTKKTGGVSASSPSASASAAASSSSTTTHSRFGHASSVSDLDAKIAAAKADIAGKGWHCSPR
jgi:hypothetical protein